MALGLALKDIRRLLPEQHEETAVRNVNNLHDDSLTIGQRVADSVARNMGSWRFIIIQSILLVAWIVANVALAAREYALFGSNFRAWDLYPFVALNLVLSFQAAYAAPIIMMSQNRQSDKDRLMAEHDYHVNIRSEATVRAILEHLKAQDDVILSILRQLESIHHVTPNQEQIGCEERLADVRKTEERMVLATIREEEAEAGLTGAG